MPSTRHLALPSLALAAVLTIAPGAAATADPTAPPAERAAAASTCGRAAVPATYETVHHPAVTRTIPAQTHGEWRWQREVATIEVEVARIVSAAARRYLWSRVVESLEAQYTRTVVDQAHVPGSPEEGHFVTEVVTPAVNVTEWEYRQQRTGNLRWENSPTWNPGGGWDLTGTTRSRELTPAVTRQVWVVTRPAVPEVPEVSHVETVWVPVGEAGPAGYAATGQTRVAGSSLETVTLADGLVPDGTGWVQGEASETAAVIEALWIPEGQAAPDGFTSTGASRAGVPTLETTPLPSPTSPAGDGWAVVPGSEVVITDVEETVEIVIPARDEQVLVTPGVPATAPCAVDPAEEPGDQSGVGGVSENAPDGSPAAATGHPAVADGDAGATLPATGAEVSPWLLALGGTSLLAGLALVRGRRRVS